MSVLMDPNLSTCSANLRAVIGIFQFPWRKKECAEAHCVYFRMLQSRRSGPRVKRSSMQRQIKIRWFIFTNWQLFCWAGAKQIHTFFIRIGNFRLSWVILIFWRLQLQIVLKLFLFPDIFKQWISYTYSRNMCLLLFHPAACDKTWNCQNSVRERYELVSYNSSSAWWPS